jgi:hypothetical protein
VAVVVWGTYYAGGIIVVVSRLARQRLLIHLGYRWTFIRIECQICPEVELGGEVWIWMANEVASIACWGSRKYDIEALKIGRRHVDKMTGKCDILTAPTDKASGPAVTWMAE